MFRLYGPELIMDPAGLGVRDKGEYADYFALELYFKGGLLRKLAGALESAEAFLAGRRLSGLGADILSNVAGGTAVAAAVPGPQQPALIGASIVAKVAGMVTSFGQARIAERREKNAEAGMKRLETNYTKPMLAAYRKLAEALAARGVVLRESASSGYYDALLKRIKARHLEKYVRGEHIYRGPLLAYMKLVDSVTARVKKTPALKTVRTAAAPAVRVTIPSASLPSAKLAPAAAARAVSVPAASSLAPGTMSLVSSAVPGSYSPAVEETPATPAEPGTMFAAPGMPSWAIPAAVGGLALLVMFMSVRRR